MKKLLIFCVTVLAAGCACNAKVKKEEPAPVPAVEVETPVAVPCSYSCVMPEECNAMAEPVVLKPRVTEKVMPKIKRPCCVDEKDLALAEAKEIIPQAPEIYMISANRTVNTMLKEAGALYSNGANLKIFVAEENAKSADLPGGMDKGTVLLKKGMSTIPGVTVTENENDADYVIYSQADWYDTATKTVPAIRYDILLKEKNGHLIGQWSEIVHQAEGDRSWW